MDRGSSHYSGGIAIWPAGRCPVQNRGGRGLADGSSVGRRARETANFGSISATDRRQSATGRHRYTRSAGNRTCGSASLRSPQTIAAVSLGLRCRWRKPPRRFFLASLPLRRDSIARWLACATRDER
jgi:hypothetical protein